MDLHTARAQGIRTHTRTLSCSALIHEEIFLSTVWKCSMIGSNFDSNLKTSRAAVYRLLLEDTVPFGLLMCPWGLV